MKEPDFATNRIVGCSAQSITLHDELGEIDYVFSDKTGTITQNELRFRTLSVNGHSFDCTINEVTGELSFDNLNKADQTSLKNFFLCISLCHDCITVEVAGKKIYTGPSMDEQCLLNMAKDAKVCCFYDRDSESIRVKLDEKEQRYTVVKVYPFTSERKTMTVIVKSQETGRMVAFSKGADDVISRLCSKVNDADMEIVNQFASRGLRTLMFGMREIENLSMDQIDSMT